jgi:hypothetical protein
MRRRKASWITLAVACGLAGQGCGGRLVKVTGEVTLDGRPLGGAMVLFIPEIEGEGTRSASGQTDAKGRFQLTTRAPDDGALPGNYKVVVQYNEPIALKEPAGNVRQAMEGAQQAQKEKAGKRPRIVLPPIYSDPAKTILRQKVPTDGKVTLSLQSQPS